MFQNVLLFCLLSTLCTNIYAQDISFFYDDLSVNNEVEDLSNLSISQTLQQEIFYTNQSNTAYYIDFEATRTTVTQLQLWKNQETLVFTEITSEMPFNTIYELNVDGLEPGSYSIELTTIDDDVIIQLFDVKKDDEQIVKKERK